MRRIKRYLNKMQAISLILATIVIIVIPITHNTKLVSIGWFLLGCNAFGCGMFTKKWGLDGITWFRRNDKDYKKNLTRKYSDLLFYIIGAFGMFLCIVTLFENTFKENYIALLIGYIISIIVLVVIFSMTDRVSKQIEQLIPNKK